GACNQYLRAEVAERCIAGRRLYGPARRRLRLVEGRERALASLADFGPVLLLVFAESESGNKQQSDDRHQAAAIHFFSPVVTPVIVARPAAQRSQRRSESL